MVQAKKSLGQNFLHNEGVILDIVDAVASFESNSVLEVGPGEGALTKHLYKKFDNFKAVELDHRLIEYLPKQFPGLKLIHSDFLKFDVNKAFDGPFIVAGNFPYNISSQILFKIVDHKELIPGMVGMFQKEVADRVGANFGNKQYGVISVLIQLYYHVEDVVDVGPENFRPAPKVWSKVIKLVRKPEEDFGVSYQEIRSVVKAAFSQRRKVLNNALKPMLPGYEGGNEFIDSILRKRAEALSVENFVELTRQIKSLKGVG